VQRYGFFRNRQNFSRFFFAKIACFFSPLDLRQMRKALHLYKIYIKGAVDALTTDSLLTRQGIAPGVCNQMMVARVFGSQNSSVTRRQASGALV